VLVDNFMEAYHHLATHRDTLQPLLPAALSYVPENEGPYSALVMPPRPASGESAPTADSPNAGIPDDGPKPLVAAVVYPTHLFAPSEHSLAWYHILPERHDRFTLRIYTCFYRDALEDEAQSHAVRGLHELTKAIHHQDISACESVWSGLASPTFDSGPLSSLEKAIWQFNQWWTDRMVLT
jgi:phenylpropionate dioxygenase-like ring-hydroxylating dioxygenase large terminal subunit